MPPAIAMLSPFQRGGPARSSQPRQWCAGRRRLCGERVGEHLGEVRGGQRHAPHIWMPPAYVKPYVTLQESRRAGGITRSRRATGVMWRLGGRTRNAEPVDSAVRTTHLCHRILECVLLTGT